MTSLMTLVCVYLLMRAVNIEAGMCSSSSCLNGGQMIMPNSVFGLCRCRCPDNFHGPRCQFVGKRAAPPPLSYDKLRAAAAAAAADSSISNNHDVDDDRRRSVHRSVHDVISQLRGTQPLTDFHGE